MTLSIEEIRDRFHLELGRLVHAYAQFDFNVGTALSWMGWHHGEDVSGLLIGSKPVAQRLEKLKPMVLKAYAPGGHAVLAEFERWFDTASDLKALRNDYVHARWGLPGHYESDEPILKMLPMNWDFTPGRPDESVDVTLSSLGEQVRAIQKLTAAYSALQKKHGAHMTLPVGYK